MYLQLFFNTIVSGFLLALVAIGFNLIFNTTKVFHLAHAAFYVVGAYTLVEIKKYFSQPDILYFLTSITIAAIIVAFLSILTELLVYQPLAKRKIGQASTLISSLAVYIFLVNLIAWRFTNESKFMALSIGKSFSWNTIVIIPIQVIQLIVSCSLLIVILFFSRLKIFLRIKAVMSNEKVASVLGVNSKRIRIVTMILGSFLAAVGGILKFLDSGISPYSGMTITLSAAAAVIIGGNNSIKGTIIASLLVCLLQTIAEALLSSQWKDCVTFLLLIIIILWKTEGIVSFKMRLEEK